MSTNVASVTSHFPDAENGFTTTTSGSVASGAATVGLNSVAGYTNGQPVVLVIDPSDASKKQTFTGIVDTSGVQVTSVVWTAGTNTTHALGATVVDYATATHIAMMSKGIQVEHNQDGTHADITADSITAPTGTFDTLTVGSQTPSADWTASTAPTTVTYNGNRSYDLVFNSTDLTGAINPGTRLKTTRTVAAPTQSTSLNGTTQYWVKTSPNKLTFTDDFVVSAWVKLSSYASSTIVSRYNGTSGWELSLNSSGQVYLQGRNAGAANLSYVLSYQSLPLNKWVHITAQLDMSTFTATTTTSYIMLDGVDIPSSVARQGTNPTALVQAGNLEIGSLNGGTNFFPGKIAQVAVFNAKVTQATIKGYISQGLIGTETSLASAYSFNGVTTDLNTTTPNDLSAGAGSPTATNADSPFGIQASGLISSTLDYGIVQAATFTTNTTLTVQVPEGCTIPTSGGVTAVSYSGIKAPYGFPSQVDKWRLLSILKIQSNNGVITTNSYTNIASWRILVPIGHWKLTQSQFSLWTNGGAPAYTNTLVGLSTTLGTFTSDLEFSKVQTIATSTGTVQMNTPISSNASYSSVVATTVYVVQQAQTQNQTIHLDGALSPAVLSAENGFL